MKGKIKWYNEKKGYGFLLGEDGKDVFIHRSEIKIAEGDDVEYDIVEMERGPKAVNLRRLGKTVDTLKPRYQQLRKE